MIDSVGFAFWRGLVGNIWNKFDRWNKFISYLYKWTTTIQLFWFYYDVCNKMFSFVSCLNPCFFCLSGLTSWACDFSKRSLYLVWMIFYLVHTSLYPGQTSSKRGFFLSFSPLRTRSLCLVWTSSKRILCLWTKLGVYLVHTTRKMIFYPVHTSLCLAQTRKRSTYPVQTILHLVQTGFYLVQTDLSILVDLILVLVEQTRSDLCGFGCPVSSWACLRLLQQLHICLLKRCDKVNEERASLEETRKN